MKRIFCYGDSNTWGSAAFGGRIAEGEQWPNILEKLSNNRVVQEGLNARVAGSFETRLYLNGKTHYEAILRSARPVDIVIIALGTNDIKIKYGRNAQQIVEDLLWYETTTQRVMERFDEQFPRIIYILPGNFMSSDYYEGDESLRQEVIAAIKASGREYIELENIKLTEDGVHYSPKTHEVIAQKVYKKLQNQEVAV